MFWTFDISNCSNIKRCLFNGVAQTLSLRALHTLFFRVFALFSKSFLVYLEITCISCYEFSERFLLLKMDKNACKDLNEEFDVFERVVLLYYKHFLKKKIAVDESCN